jgi:predicted metal-dependent HD superfamily phosphohydrolase
MGGVAAEGMRAFDDLLTCYTEPHRAYHNARHIAECLRALDTAGGAEEPDAVEMALWTHDVIYDPHAHDNEVASAAWVAERLPLWSEPLRTLILATQHKELPQSPDACLIVDIDLSILASEPARFDEYEAQIRAEYAFVPEDDFRRGRTAILQRFLDRPSLFHTPLFRQRCEEAARANLTRSLMRLLA